MHVYIHQSNSVNVTTGPCCGTMAKGACLQELPLVVWHIAKHLCQMNSGT